MGNCQTKDLEKTPKKSIQEEIETQDYRLSRFSVSEKMTTNPATKVE